MIRYASRLLFPLAALLLAGCGGGGGHESTGPGDDPQCADVLRAAGLTIIYQADKGTYQKGETVHFWLSLRNDSSQPHTVAVHTVLQGYETYSIAVWGDDPYHWTWGHYYYDTPSWQIQPGQTVTLFDVQWDQSTNAGSSAAAGHYEIATTINNVWLDGKEATPLPLTPSQWIQIE